MGNIARLSVDESVTIDIRRMEEIVNELGEPTAMEVIAAALEQLALALARTSQAADDGDLAHVVNQADRLSRLAWQVGLVSFSGVAVDVGNCAERRDLGALAATVARLRRIGNQSLTEVWELPDKTG